MNNRLVIVRENINTALVAIRTNRLRTTLTVLIISIGITALIGILTAIDSIKGSINSEFSRMGSNTITLSSRGMDVHVGNKHYRSKNQKSITYKQAVDFKERFEFPANTSIFCRPKGNSTVKYASEKTDPNIRIIGSDENFLLTSGYEIKEGRNISENDINSNLHVALIGEALSKQLVGDKTSLIEKFISIDNIRFQVVGVLKSKGTSMGGDRDKFCIIPVSNARQNFVSQEMTFNINISPLYSTLIEAAESEARGLFRIIRRLELSDEDDFNINKSDNIASLLIENLKYVSIATTLIGIITLVGAAIGLMNIMLVSVSERTREIGIRKALGANSKIILRQFLYESIIIGQIGGTLGVIFGLLIGNVVSLSVGNSFIVPWLWIALGFILCFVVGVLAGILPAMRAAKLDPIEALRYE